jgi:sec-independent protein translocase protein TatA
MPGLSYEPANRAQKNVTASMSRPPAAISVATRPVLRHVLGRKRARKPARQRSVVMGALAPSHWILLLLVVVLLFGTGRISSVMGDFAKGLKAFRKNMAEESDVSMEAQESRAAAPSPTIAPPPAQVPPSAAGQPHGTVAGQG